MNILLIGSGGRENAIAKGLYESEGLKKIFCTPDPIKSIFILFLTI